MPTDDERREVAHNIRENYVHGGLGYKVATAHNIAMAIGMNPGVLVGDIELWYRLADLIDRSCDRDALLALADDLDYAGASVENVAYIDQTFHESARRIREALGVDDA